MLTQGLSAEKLVKNLSWVSTLVKFTLHDMKFTLHLQFLTLSWTLQFLKEVLALGFRASCICHLDRIVRTIDEDCCGLDPTEVVHFELQW